MCIRIVTARVTKSYSQSYRKLQSSCSYNITERSFRAHWIPQCGPGNKAADGDPVRVDFNIPGHSYSTTKIKREEPPPLRNVH